MTETLKHSQMPKVVRGVPTPEGNFNQICASLHGSIRKMDSPKPKIAILVRMCRTKPKAFHLKIQNYRTEKPLNLRKC
jgi:hypothetical protein